MYLTTIFRSYQIRKYGICVHSICCEPYPNWINVQSYFRRKMLCMVFRRTMKIKWNLMRPQIRFNQALKHLIVMIIPALVSKLRHFKYKTITTFILTCFFLFYDSVTIDVKRNIFDLSVNRYGSQIAIVENHGDFESLQESAVRIYSVGRRKNIEDEAVIKKIFKFKMQAVAKKLCQ